MKKLIGNFLILASLVFLTTTAYLYWQRINPNRLSFETKSDSYSEVYKSDIYPEKIIIDDLSIELAIIPQEKKGDKWETTTKGVSYLKNSPIPGEIGNSIIYGHNWNNILGNLQKIKSDSEIRIIFSDSSERMFKINKTATVAPSDTYILENTLTPQLTLYTCSGFLDTKRFVVVAEPK